MLQPYLFLSQDYCLSSPDFQKTELNIKKFNVFIAFSFQIDSTVKIK